MKRQLIFLFILALFFFNGYSQACGGGILTLNMYTINGKAIKEVSYEIFPVSEELIGRHNFQDSRGSVMLINDFSESESIQNEKSNSKLDMFLERSSISRSGKFTDALKFKTKENEYFPIILKISVKGQTVYILGNYFGGCDREVRLFWNGKYIGL